MQKEIDSVTQMFDQISERYDRTNRILSLGNDVRWRKKLASFLPKKKDMTILDLATGTADQIISFFQCSQNIQRVIGLDPSKLMLEKGRKKLSSRPYYHKIDLIEGNALQIPFLDNRFDVTSVSFGIRNFSDPEKGLREMHRVLKKEGKVLILEFSLPSNRVCRSLSLFYLKRFVPLLGKMVTSKQFAYEYLSKTIQDFPHGKDFISLMQNAGFRNIQQKKLSLGMVSIYTGVK